MTETRRPQENEPKNRDRRTAIKKIAVGVAVVDKPAESSKMNSRSPVPP
jgi:hypothetical protein